MERAQAARTVLHEQILRAFDAALNDVLVHGNAGGFAEERFEVRGAYASDRGDAGERQVLGQMIFDVGERLLEPATTETAILSHRALRYRAMSRD